MAKPKSQPNKKAKKKTPKKNGRPRGTHTKIDWKLVSNLLAIQCTGEEIAATLNMSYDTLERACKREQKMLFAEYSEQKRAGGRASLRRRQWIMAESNVAMAIFLGKNMLGQSDKLGHEVSGKDGRGLKVEVEFVKP